MLLIKTKSMFEKYTINWNLMLLLKFDTFEKGNQN